MKTTSYDLCNEALSLERAIEPLEEYYQEKKASLIFHLDSVDETHHNLVEIAKEIEDTKKEIYTTRQKSRELELIADFDFAESLNDIDTDFEALIKNWEKEWENENVGRGILKTARIMRGKEKFHSKPYRKLYRKQKK